jgi:hypothetical protein
MLYGKKVRVLSKQSSSSNQSSSLIVLPLARAL